MKNRFKLFYLVLMIGFVGIASSCSSDNPVAPIITYPSTGVTPEVKVNEDFDFIFTVVAEGGYDSHLITAASGTVVESSSTPGFGEHEFTISGTFTAGDVAGPGAITLSVHDARGLTTTKTMAVVIVL